MSRESAHGQAPLLHVGHDDAAVACSGDLDVHGIAHRDRCRRLCRTAEAGQPLRREPLELRATLRWWLWARIAREQQIPAPFPLSFLRSRLW